MDKIDLKYEYIIYIYINNLIIFKALAILLIDSVI